MYCEIDKELLLKFKAVASLENRTMREIIVEYMQHHIKKHVGNSRTIIKV